MRVTLGWARCADNVADILARRLDPIVGRRTPRRRRSTTATGRLPRAKRDGFGRRSPDHWSIVARTGVLRAHSGRAGE